MCRRPLRHLAVSLPVALLCLSLACESTPTPTAPSGSLQVTAPAPTLRSGDTTQLVVATQGTAAPTVTWTSSDASVASVSGGGLVTARRAGRATITASTGSASGQVALRVVPDFSGTWTGALSRDQPTCSPSSAAAVCTPGTPAEALRAPLTLVLTQAGAVVTGTLVDGLEPQVVVTVQGQIDEIDSLLLEGASASVPGVGPPPSRRLTVSSFRASYDPSLQTITGAFRLAADRLDAAGAFVVDYAFQGRFRDLPRR